MAEDHTADSRTAPDFRPLEELLDYRFQETHLLRQALTHPSFAREHDMGLFHNQRLEFLGDSILGAVLAETLFENFPLAREGKLSRHCSVLCKGETLATIGEELNLDAWLRLGLGESGDRYRGRARRLEDAVEAVIGAVYLDGGWSAARALVRKLYGDIDRRLREAQERHNPKGRLQEWVQAKGNGATLVYEQSGETGPGHAKRFTSEVWIGDQCLGRGEGSSLKEAESAAAAEALEQLQDTEAAE